MPGVRLKIHRRFEKGFIMGGMMFSTETLGDSLSETAGYRPGLLFQLKLCVIV